MRIRVYHFIFVFKNLFCHYALSLNSQLNWCWLFLHQVTVAHSKYIFEDGAKKQDCSLVSDHRYNNNKTYIRQQLMGIVQSSWEKPDHNNQKIPQSQSQSLNYGLLIDLAILIKDEILKQFEKQKINVRQFKKQMLEPNDTENMRKTNNFLGRVDSQGNIYGICKFFNKVQNVCNVYIGYMKDGLAEGRGIKIKTYFIPNSENANEIAIDKNNYQACLMEQWKITNINQQGCLIKKNNEKYDIFIGKFINGEYHEGVLKLRQGERIKMIYTGQFQNSQMHGKGKLQIPGIYKYVGSFNKQIKEGLGEEWDEKRQTYYIGQFEAGNRDGYGELVYLNREKLRLKGFWELGQIKPKQGVYVNKNGEYLQTLGDDIHLL